MTAVIESHSVFAMTNGHQICFGCPDYGVVTFSVLGILSNIYDQVLGLVCNLAHLIRIIIMSTCHKHKNRCRFCECEVVMTKIFFVVMSL